MNVFNFVLFARHKYENNLTGKSFIFLWLWSLGSSLLLLGFVLFKEKLTLLLLFSLDFLHELLVVSQQFFSLVIDKVYFLN